MLHADCRCVEFISFSFSVFFPFTLLQLKKESKHYFCSSDYMNVWRIRKIRTDFLSACKTESSQLTKKKKKKKKKDVWREFHCVYLQLSSSRQVKVDEVIIGQSRFSAFYQDHG